MAHTRSVNSEAMYTQSEVDKIIKESDKAVKEKMESLKVKQGELDRQWKEMEKCREEIEAEENAAVRIDSISAVISALHRDIMDLKQLPGQMQELRQEMTLRKSRGDHSTPQHQVTEDYIFEGNSSIKLRDVIDTIPRFDGHNMPVHQFAKICERADNLISTHQRYNLVQMTINKLYGHSYSISEGTKFQEMYTLLRKLKQAFGINKSADQLRGELGNIFMRHNESIFDYIARIKDIRSALQELEDPLEQNSYASDAVDRSVLTSFINGLPFELMIRVRLEDYYGLEDAIDNRNTS